MTQQKRQEGKLRVLIADDHNIVRSGLSALITLQEDMTVVAEAANGREAVALAVELSPDVILMDIEMPVMDGIEAIGHIMAADQDASIAVLTTFDGDEDVFRAVKAGAKAFLLKDSAPDDLFRTMRSLAAGRTCVAPSMAAKLAQRIQGDELTHREREVLGLMAAGKTNRAIGESLFVAESTVKTHINNILAKLGAKDRTEAAALALRRGILHLDKLNPPSEG